MNEKEEVLKAIQRLDREDFETLCLDSLEKLGIDVSNFKAEKDCITVEGTIETDDGTKDYIAKFSRSVDESSLEELKKSLPPSTDGLFLTPEKIKDQVRYYEGIEVVGGEKLYRLLEKFNLVSRIQVKEDEDPTQALREKAEFFLNQDKYDEATDLLERAIEIDEDVKEDWMLLGKARSLKGEKEKALEAYDRAGELQPNDTDILKKKGRLLYELERYDEAILCFEDILETGRESKEVWNNKALCHLRNSEFKESIESIEKALFIDPRFEDALLNKALVYEKKGDIEKALDAIEELIRYFPNKAEYHYIRAAYLVSLERFEEGNESVEEALELDPDHEEAKKLKSRLDNFL